MKQRNYIKRTRMLTLALCAAGCAAFGQGPGGGPDNGPGGGPGQDGNGPPPPPPLPPVIHALDTNHDGIIEADEIANAAKSLRTLETSGSDELTIPELLGPPPPPPGQGPGGPQASGTDAQGGPPPPPPPPPDGAQTSGTGSQDQPPPGPPPGPGGHRHHRLPPVIEVLDANHDGIIDASEIDNAPQSLKKLDRKGTGQLTIPELLGPPRRPPGGRGGPGPGNGQDGPPPGPPPDQSGTDGAMGGPPPGQ